MDGVVEPIKVADTVTVPPLGAVFPVLAATVTVTCNDWLTIKADTDGMTVTAGVACWIVNADEELAGAGSKVICPGSGRKHTSHRIGPG